jgi:hypothetical protein
VEEVRLLDVLLTIEHGHRTLLSFFPSVIGDDPGDCTGGACSTPYETGPASNESELAPRRSYSRGAGRPTTSLPT